MTNQSKTYCSRPFVHGLIDTNGDVKPCCRARLSITEFKGKVNYNINQDSIVDWWSSEYMEYMRSNLLAGNRLAECERCYRQEDQDAISFRERSNKDFGVVTTQDELPRDWELRATNLCNLKCMMCTGGNSSALMTEDRIIFGLKDLQKTYDWNDYALDQVHKIFNKLSSTILRGGEPFMVPWIRQTLQDCPEDRASEIEIMFTTNLTKLTDDWIPILSKFKHIKMGCSIDAFDDLNYYIRYPAKWKEILNGLAVARSLPNVNIFLNVCVQNLNILYLDKLLLWAQEQNIYVVLDILTAPSIFEISNLPPELIDQAINRLETVREQIDLTMIDDFDGVLNGLHAKDTKPNNWSQFINYIQAKDKHRKLSITNFIPELAEYFNE